MVAFGHYVTFAVCYSLGTVASLLRYVRALSWLRSPVQRLHMRLTPAAAPAPRRSTLFLWGPWHQIKNMFKETRWLATLIMLAAIAMTLVSALVWHSVGLCILFAIIQFAAVFWYSISYIPYAR